MIDTNVIFEGLTTRGGAAGLVVDAWVGGRFQPFISNALAYEYREVLERMLSVERWRRLRPVLGRLLRTSQFVPIHFTWRPVSPDPADDHVIDCAMNAAAVIVTSNTKDFRLAERALGIPVRTPVEFLKDLAAQTERS